MKTYSWKDIREALMARVEVLREDESASDTLTAYEVLLSFVDAVEANGSVLEAAEDCFFDVEADGAGNLCARANASNAACVTFLRAFGVCVLLVDGRAFPTAPDAYVEAAIERIAEEYSTLYY